MRRVDVRKELELVADSARGPERIVEVEVRCRVGVGGRSGSSLTETPTCPRTASRSWGFRWDVLG